MAGNDRRKLDGIIVVARGDFGMPSPTSPKNGPPSLLKVLRPLRPDKAVDKNGSGRMALVEGEEYEYTGDPELLKQVYPKGHPKAGQPAGLNTLFYIKGATKKE